MELEQLQKELRELFRKQMFSSSWGRSEDILDAFAEKLYKAGEQAGLRKGAEMMGAYTNQLIPQALLEKLESAKNPNS